MSRSYKDINTISKEVKHNLHKEFPGTKWSVRIQKYSGGRSMSVDLMEAPFEVFSDPETGDPGMGKKGYAQVNHYWLGEPGHSEYLTPKAIQVLKKATRIANSDNWDNSDIQTDYFDVNYYFSLGVGQWDKPFKVVEQKPAAKTRTSVRKKSVSGRSSKSPAGLGRVL